MARHAQPREMASLKGADKKDPQRYRRQAPKAGLPLGNAPADMTAEQKAAWFELSTYALPGVMTGADRFVLELAASLLAEYRQDRQGFNTARLTALIGVIARLGMSPADRTKLGVEKPKEENPFANLDS